MAPPIIDSCSDNRCKDQCKQVQLLSAKGQLVSLKWHAPAAACHVAKSCHQGSHVQYHQPCRTWRHRSSTPAATIGARISASWCSCKVQRGCLSVWHGMHLLQHAMWQRVATKVLMCSRRAAVQRRCGDAIRRATVQCSTILLLLLSCSVCSSSKMVQCFWISSCIWPLGSTPSHAQRSALDGR
jgi:hypothetical protein